MMAMRASHAPAWPLDRLLAGFVAPGTALPPLPISGLAQDSRKAAPGVLFLACQGEHQHGLDFAREVAARGTPAIAAEPSERWPHTALAALATELGIPLIPIARLGKQAGAIAARFHRDPSAALEVIGITGTNGKTSVSHFIAQSLACELRCAIIGTLGQGFPGALTSTGMTTPDALSLQSTLADLLAQDAEAVAMEISSHALAQHRADAVHVDYGLLTNLTRDHLDYHGSMAAYAEAKARLFSLPGLRWAILNADDEFTNQLLPTLAPEVKLALYSLNPGLTLSAAWRGRCDLLVQARVVQPHQRGLRLRVQAQEPAGAGEMREGQIETRLIGRFNAANLLASLALLLARGIAFDTGLSQLGRVTGVPGRMECFGGAGEPLCVVDYAHTPDALEQALVGLRAHCSGKLIVVFGCGGERDRGKRPLMGQVAARLADGVIVTDDNPRHEDGDAIIAEILAGMHTPDGAQSGAPSRIIERQRGIAIRRALLLAGPADAVLIAGKGHETEQDMGELKVRFSDRAQVMQALSEWQGRNQ
jgi:UDP-N-acetylmuramoyl-L-alanyl-D-glutamate--2,6-diaminopimelate ligase